jgi:hypothetical protein
MLYLYIVLAVLGFEFRASHLLGWPSIVLVIWRWVLIFLPRMAWSTILPFYTSCCGWDDWWVPPHPAFPVETSLKLFCSGWQILLISASQVVKIKGVGHQYWLVLIF